MSQPSLIFLRKRSLQRWRSSWHRGGRELEHCTGLDFKAPPGPGPIDSHFRPIFYSSLWLAANFRYQLAPQLKCLPCMLEVASWRQSSVACRRSRARRSGLTRPGPDRPVPAERLPTQAQPREDRLKNSSSDIGLPI